MNHFSIFLSAAAILAVVPGPGLFYVLARSMANGTKDGLRSSAGTFVGGMFHVFAAGLGISAVLATSALAFAVVKYAGAAYLVFLGVRMILSRNEEPVMTAKTKGADPLLQGIWTEMLNPKTALFFLSFIPQFVVASDGNVFRQFFFLGSLSVCLNTMADVLVACFAGPLGQRLVASKVLRRRQRTASGIGMIGLGIYVAARD
jgi:threonine/homoserine/homoserine lactone efflux protein